MHNCYNEYKEYPQQTKTKQKEKIIITINECIIEGMK